jgi:hypothetical protein
LQRSSKIKALERKGQHFHSYKAVTNTHLISVWNETTANRRKRAPTVTGLQSAPAAKLARKTPAKISHAESQGHERSARSSKSATVSIEDSDTVSEYGESDNASEKSDDDDDMEVPEDDDFESLSQEELVKEVLDPIVRKFETNLLT